MTEKIHDLLVFLYGSEVGLQTYERFNQILANFKPPVKLHNRLDSKDVVLITYGDQFIAPDEPPLETLNRFAHEFLEEKINGIHVLPFYPWTSDDGFSVLDYYQVDPAMGDWESIQSLNDRFDLMFDGVINHCSARSPWFQGFHMGDKNFKDFFISIDPQTDLRQVVRPRTLPLLTSFETSSGKEWIWTTFSSDQVDLNYHNPSVLEEMIRVLLFYVQKGARFIRLDAIAYLWKEPGTSCIHLPQTHAIVKLIRCILDEVAPYVILITETNVNHQENLSYFGDGKDEAHLVYNFALPPLVMFSLLTGKSERIRTWAEKLTLPGPQTTFFNFLASHDGIGINPSRGILDDSEIELIIQKTIENNGFTSWKTNPQGGESVYELNINYLDAFGKSGPDQIDQFLCAHAIMLSLPGLPGIYVHSLLGSKGWVDGVRQTGRNRSVNRQKLDYPQLKRELTMGKDETSTRRQKVMHGIFLMLAARAASQAFNPYGEMRVFYSGDQTFSFIRFSPQRDELAICIHNLSAETVIFQVENLVRDGFGGEYRDLISGQKVMLANHTTISLHPYQYVWLVQ